MGDFECQRARRQLYGPSLMFESVRVRGRDSDRMRSGALRLTVVELRLIDPERLAFRVVKTA
jgi:hypothetical protein